MFGYDRSGWSNDKLDYMPFQAICEPTRQALWSSPIFFIKFISSNLSLLQPDRSSLPSLPSKPFLNQHTKCCKSVLSFFIRFIIHQWLLWHRALFSASANASYDAFLTSCWERPISEAFFCVLVKIRVGNSFEVRHKCLKKPHQHRFLLVRWFSWLIVHGECLCFIHDDNCFWNCIPGL